MRVRALAPADVVRLGAAPFTYAEVGATQDTTLPAGYHHQDHTIVLGRGLADYAVAAERLVTWEMHSRSGFRVETSTPRVEVGSVVRLALVHPALGLGGSCRVVWAETLDRTTAWGYSTLQGHPESGEESFRVTWGDDDAVVFVGRSFSRPGTRLARLAGPLGRVAQRVSLGAYARSLRP